MSRGGIEALLGLMDEAFDGGGIEASNESQALLTNLATVADDQWRARPAGATRTIESIALHVGACKVMYDDYAFGQGRSSSEREKSSHGDPKARRRWRRSCLGSGLRRRGCGARGGAGRRYRARPTAADELGRGRPTRWIVASMITHDAYHAGEINHLRSLLSGDDRWRYVQLGFG